RFCRSALSFAVPAPVSATRRIRRCRQCRLRQRLGSDTAGLARDARRRTASQHAGRTRARRSGIQPARATDGAALLCRRRNGNALADPGSVHARQTVLPEPPAIAHRGGPAVLMSNGLRRSDTVAALLAGFGIGVVLIVFWLLTREQRAVLDPTLDADSVTRSEQSIRAPMDTVAVDEARGGRGSIARTDERIAGRLAADPVRTAPSRGAVR